MNKILFGFLLISLTFVFSPKLIMAQQPRSCIEGMSPMFGITVESLENLEKLKETLNEIKRECVPTLRVVFQPRDKKETEEEVLENYFNALKELRGDDPVRPNYAYILGLLVDSKAFSLYNETQMRNRARDYGIKLNKYVDVWETGNEINGDWVGWKNDYEKQNDTALKNMRVSVGVRVRAVHEELSGVYSKLGKTPKFALNLYFNDDNIKSEKDGESYKGENCRPSGLEFCNEECQHDYEMFTWTRKYLNPPNKAKLKFDYVLFSYYKDDCCNVPTYPEFWARVFAQLSSEFTVGNQKPKVGFGEVGPQCHCATDEQGKPLIGDSDEITLKRRTHECCRLQKVPFIKFYYGNLHAEIKKAISSLPPAQKPDYVGGFFYWYFYQDALGIDDNSKDARQSFIDAAKSWKR